MFQQNNLEQHLITRSHEIRRFIVCGIEEYRPDIESGWSDFCRTTCKAARVFEFNAKYTSQWKNFESFKQLLINKLFKLITPIFNTKIIQIGYKEIKEISQKS